MNLEKFSLLSCAEESLKKFDLQVKDKRELISLINDSVFRKCARTSKEKYELLDLRDKFLKLIRYEIQGSSNDSIVLNGTCSDMCPEKERYCREYLSFTSIYESLNDQIDHRLMIKEYSRSSADQDLPLPNELRPIDVLFETMLHIIDQVISRMASDQNFPNEAAYGDWYDFAWNRTRAIRKEIIQQRLLLNDNNSINNEQPLYKDGIGGVLIIEQCARFQILCAYRLSDQGPKVFDFKINEDNLKNCFQSLRQYYEETMSGHDSSQSRLVPSPNETEFRSYIILLNLNQSDILSEILHWSPYIRTSSHVKFALAVYNAYNSRNYVKFFRLFKSTDCTYLQACILHRYICVMRCIAFKIIFSSYKDQREKIFPVNKIADLLGFDTTDDVYDYCDIFELETDETNIIMRSASYSIFNMSKSNEDRLRIRRSKLLVDSKFRQNSSLTNEECLSKIISGKYVSNEVSSFGVSSTSTHLLGSSFDDDDYYCSTEINDMLENVTSKSNRMGLKSLHSSQNPSVKIAHNLVKGAIQLKNTNKISKDQKLSRKSSTSSNSSTSSTDSHKPLNSRPKNFENNIRPALAGNLFGAAISQAQKDTGLFTKTTMSKINPFSVIANTEKIATSIPKNLFWQQTSTESVSKEQPKNLFEKLIKQNDQQQDTNELKQKQLNLKTESYFQSLHLELIKEVTSEFLNNFKTIQSISLDLTASFLDNVIDNEIRCILDETIPAVKSLEIAEKRQKELELQKKEESLIQFQQFNLILNEVFGSLVNGLIKEECTNFLKLYHQSQLEIYDDILCSIFQNEFDIILKNIANELNRELFLDRLSHDIYFNDNASTSTEIALVDKKCDYGIFTTDLSSFMHDCVYEFTRLNLNVNRELYFELRQAIILNEKKHLFRKWRLKLSLKLLKTVHKRTSLDNKQRQQAPTHIETIKNSNQHNLITFIKTYGSFMLANINRFQNILKYMIEDEDQLNDQLSIIHSDEFQMHLTWNLSINYRHILYEILIGNFFDIINNRDDHVLLPPHISHELFAKIPIGMGKLNTESEDVEAIKRWLLSKFFKKNQTSHNESLSVTHLHSNQYGLRFCTRLCQTGLTESEYKLKLSKREFYGSNSLIFVLQPCENNEYEKYLIESRKSFLQIMRLFNENLDLNSPDALDSYQFMFISYLNGHNETNDAIDFILGRSNFCYCLLDGEVVKDNSMLQACFNKFLKKIYLHNSKIYENTTELSTSRQILKYENVNNVASLSDIFEMTISKFLEFLTHSIGTIHLTFESFIEEYNTRLEVLLRMLTRDEYRLLAWPIPELCDVKFNSNNWTLRIWNTNECFDNIIRKQFFDLMSLGEDRSISCDSRFQEEKVEVDLIETKIFRYAEKLLNSKAHMLKYKSECSKSNHQLENSIKNIINEMKKSATDNKMSKFDILWPHFMSAIVEYLLTNGYLLFQDSKKIFIEKLQFFYDLNELKSHDWINNVQNIHSVNSSPSSATSSYSELNHSQNKLKSAYLINKYAKKTVIATKKRRISNGDQIMDSSENESFQPNQASLEETYNLGQTFLKSFEKKNPKNQRLMSNQEGVSVPEKVNSEFDIKFQEFFSLLKTEKDKNVEFESKLTSFTDTKAKENYANLETDVLSISIDFIDEKQAEKHSNEASEIPLEEPSFNKTLDDFLKRLKEEKLSNDKFSSKLNSMLDY